MTNVFLGQISTFGFNFAPRGWSFCSGSILPISQYTALFSLLGTTFGGNGQTTFGLPDLRSRTPMHAASSGGNYSLGEMAGEENVTVLMSQMPAHTHSFGVTNVAADKPGPAGHILAQANSGGSSPVNLAAYAPSPPNTPLAAGMISVAGASLPHSNIQPYLALNFCIAMTGYYPSRN